MLKIKKKRNIILAIIFAIVLIAVIIAGGEIVKYIENKETEKLFNKSTMVQDVGFIQSKSSGEDEYSFYTLVDEIRIESTI